jgi:hypothetical protein
VVGAAAVVVGPSVVVGSVAVVVVGGMVVDGVVVVVATSSGEPHATSVRDRTAKLTNDRRTFIISPCIFGSTGGIG